MIYPLPDILRHPDPVNYLSVPEYKAQVIEAGPPVFDINSALRIAAIIIGVAVVAVVAHKVLQRR